ncbi:MAG TPA: FKBP-type peptidyl-prolyl cis-trans isomerase [Sediminibacterium sp.]|nr:FKBP-type peptidyl-prolyl cis-trans isomerase [Sediminibacterium sp.]
MRISHASLLVAGVLTVSTIGAQIKNKPVTTAKKAPVKTVTTISASTLKNKADSLSYSLGWLVGQSLKAQGFDHLNNTLFLKALTDIKAGKTGLIPEESAKACVTAFQQEVMAKQEAEREKENAVKGAANRKEGEAFLTNNAKRPGVITLPSGLQYEVLKAGTDNTKPTLNSKVTCHYTGTLINGYKFDSSVDRGAPATFQLSNVIRGWQEALQLMTVGSKWKIYVPADLGYGDNAPPNIGPGAVLIFEVELLGVAN